MPISTPGENLNIGRWILGGLSETERKPNKLKTDKKTMLSDLLPPDVIKII